MWIVPRAHYHLCTQNNTFSLATNLVFTWLTLDDRWYTTNWNWSVRALRQACAVNLVTLAASNLLTAGCNIYPSGAWRRRAFIDYRLSD